MSISSKAFFFRWLCLIAILVIYKLSSLGIRYYIKQSSLLMCGADYSGSAWMITGLSHCTWTDFTIATTSSSESICR